MKKSKTYGIAIGGLIAAMYVLLTYVSSIFGLAYGPLQFRLSEVLTILPIFTPYAIPGLAVGCFISNMASFNALDLIFGTLATVIAAYLTYAFRNIKIKKAPILSIIPPVLVNGIIVGLEIAYFYRGGFTSYGFLISGFQVMLGQFVVCFILGLPLYFWLNKYKDKLF